MKTMLALADDTDRRLEHGDEGGAAARFAFAFKMRSRDGFHDARFEASLTISGRRLVWWSAGVKRVFPIGKYQCSESAGLAHVQSDV